jgi:CRISPR-associated protein (TIGR03986 family)
MAEPTHPVQPNANARASYNYVPLSQEVVLLPYGAAISHDAPFADGYSGSLMVSFTAKTPICIGGNDRRVKAIGNAPGQVHFCKGAFGEFLAPGSGIKGAIRNQIEKVCHARMQLIDHDVRPMLREVTRGDSVPDYKTVVGNNGVEVQSGFLERKNGQIQIVPYKRARYPHARAGIGSAFSKYDDEFYPETSDLPTHSFDVDASTETAVPGTTHTGFKVFTGGMPGKLKDYVFYPYSEEKAVVPLADADWRDFLSAHPLAGKKSNPWDFWEPRFNAGRPVPVFYVQVGARTIVGLTLMLRLSATHSVGELLPDEHQKRLYGDLEETHPLLDMAEALFGFLDHRKSSDKAGKKLQADALKGRVSFESFVAQSNTLSETAQAAMILGQPRAGYFPNTLQQDDLTQYCTFSSPTKPTLRGFRSYPARDGTNAPTLADSQVRSTKTQVKLFTLPENTQFEGQIHFHNLRLHELGALIWALSWGGQVDKRHSLGMGKTFGFGQVEFAVDEVQSSITPNDEKLPKPSFVDARQEFQAYMQAVTGDSWANSESVRASLACASAAPKTQYDFLSNPILDPLARVNEFHEIKQGKKSLPLQAKAEALTVQAVEESLAVKELKEALKPTHKK